MTMISRNRGRSRLPLFLVGVLMVLLVALMVLFRTPLASAGWRLLAPVVTFRQQLQSSQVSELQAELASTSAALADRTALYQENQTLKAELGRAAQTHLLLAGVLQHPPQTPYDTLTLDVGARNGVVQGALVYAGGTYVIGTITEVYDTTSRATLLSAPGQTYQAFLNDSSAISMQGQGAGSMAGEVPAGSAVRVGDPITAPGVAGGFLGSVSHIDAQAGASFETIYTQLPADLFSIKYVELSI